jgi:hypothetical protein
LIRAASPCRTKLLLPGQAVVMVLIPPVSARRHPVDLLLCGHHYLSSKAALAAAGSVVMYETCAIVGSLASFRA